MNDPTLAQRPSGLDDSVAWPPDPRVQPLAVQTGELTVEIDGSELAWSFSGGVKGRGRLVAELFSGQASGAGLQIDASTFGDIRLSGSTLSQRGTDRMTIALALDEIQPNYCTLVEGHGVIDENVNVSAGGRLVLRHIWSDRQEQVLAGEKVELSAAEREALAEIEPPTLRVNGDLLIGTDGALEIEVPDVHLIAKPIYDGGIDRAPLTVEGGISFESLAAKLLVEIEDNVPPGRSVPLVLAERGNGSSPMAEFRLPTKARRLTGPRLTGETEIAATAAQISDLVLGGMSPISAARATGASQNTWWALNCRPENSSLAPKILLEALSVREPESWSGSRADFSDSAPDNLVLVTHGTASNVDRRLFPAAGPEPECMGQLAVLLGRLSESIYLKSPGGPPLGIPPELLQRMPPAARMGLNRDLHRLSDWQVTVLDWREYATGNSGQNVPGVASLFFQPVTSAQYGQVIGRGLADRIVAGRKRPFKKIHLLAHSSGCWLIDAFADRLREHWGSKAEGGPEITLTFFDAFDVLGINGPGVSGLRVVPFIGDALVGTAQLIGPGPTGELGESGDVVEHYLHASVPGTAGYGAGLSNNAMNIDVSQLQSAEYLPVDILAQHSWPYIWYMRTVQSAIHLNTACIPCEGEADCLWKTWGAVRSPMFQAFLAAQAPRFVSEHGLEAAMGGMPRSGRISVVPPTSEVLSPSGPGFRGPLLK